MPGNMVLRRARRVFGSFGDMSEERDPHDLYETPHEAAHMLFSNHRFNQGGILDPSAGRGKLLQGILQASPGREVYGYDLHPTTPFDGLPGINYGVDFLTTGRTQHRYIIMNPPYSQADAHVRHALASIKSNGEVAALLRFNWIAAKKRADLLPHLSKVVICGRLKMLPPFVQDKGHSGTVDFAWFIFEHRMSDETKIVRAL